MSNYSFSTMRSAVFLLPVVLLAGCEIPGLGPTPQMLARENEAKAIGSACRYAVRGLEDCYVLNPRAPKSMVFTGWKEMDLYMRDNKIEGVPSVITQSAKPARAADKEDDLETELKSPNDRS